MNSRPVRSMLGAAVLSLLLTGLAPVSAQADVIDDGVKLLETKQYAEAMKLFQKEAQKDNARAMYYVGDIISQGLGQKSQPLTATTWWEKGAYLGDVMCQLALASAYRNGAGVSVQPRQAMIWDRKAALQGNPVAMKNMGDYFAQGNGVDADLNEALRWYWQGAQAGYPGAVWSIANMLRTGEGLAKDPAAAYVLMREAAQAKNGYNADRNAAADARVIRHELTKEELARSEALTAKTVLDSIKPKDLEK